MADTTTVARPYARAAFEVARDSDSLQRWSDFLQLLSAVVKDPQMAAVLDNPDLGADTKGEAVLEVCADSASDDETRNFIRTLAANGRLPLLPEITGVFEHLRADAEKTVEAEVISARKLTKAQEEEVAAALAKRLDRRVEIHNTVDKSLLGGAIIRAGDLVIDGSARGQLHKLAVAIGQ